MNLLWNKMNEFSKDKDWRTAYYTSGQRGLTLYSKMFSTNVRGINALYKYIGEFSIDMKKPRTEWVKSGNKDEYNQSKSKQMVVPLLNSGLIYSNKEGLYSYTQKAKILKEVYEDEYFQFNDEEKNLLAAILVLNYRSVKYGSLREEFQQFNTRLQENGVTIEELKKLTEEAGKGQKKMYESKLLLYMTFYRVYDHSDFLAFIVQTDDNEVKEFFSKVRDAIEIKDETNLMAHKLKPSGVFSPSTFKEMNLFTRLFILLDEAEYGYDNFTYKLSVFDSSIISSEKLIKFLSMPEVKDVVAGVLEDLEYETNIVYTPGEIVEGEEEDITMHSNVLRNERIFDSLKPRVLSTHDYKCVFEKIRGCDMSYFTSRKTGKNYLEVHHFIPRKYSNLIGCGVEFFENYIPLCPTCHRMIHLAQDNERRSLILHALNNNHEVKSILEMAEIDGLKNVNEKILAMYDFSQYQEGKK